MSTANRTIRGHWQNQHSARGAIGFDAVKHDARTSSRLATLPPAKATLRRLAELN
jgi:hypothetical protein